MPRPDAPALTTTTPTAITPPIGFVIVLGAAALFGTLGPLSRFAYDAGMEPAAFVAWRAFIAVGATLAFVAWRLGRGSTRLVHLGSLSRRTQLTLFVAGLMGFSLNLCMFIAFDRITVALALLGFYTYPALVAVANVALGRERLDTARLIALGLALLGMVAVVASQLDPNAGIRFDALGFGLALGAAVSQMVFVVISRDGYREVPTEQAMTTVLGISVAGAASVAILSGHPEALALPIQQPSVLPLLLFTGIFAAAIPSLAFLAGLRVIGGTRAGILMLFEPVVGVVLAAWLLGEALAPIQLAGALAILGAAVILQRGSSESIETPAAGDDRGVPLDDRRALRVPGGP
jgi:drug/metabolite transporter, DME family